MASLTRLVCCLLLVSLASASTKKVLLWAAARSPEDPTAETLLELDANQDGHIDPNEVSAFAQSQGLDTASATDDFSGIDTNGDGKLDPAELIQVLGPLKVLGHGVQGSNTAVEDVTLTPIPPLAVASQLAAAKGAPHVVSGPSLRRMDQHHIGVQESHSPRIPPPPNAKTPQATGSTKQATKGGKPTPVERMVKHFAQVLKSADIVPVRAKTLKATKASSTVAPNPLAAVQSAALEVSEQLNIAEKAETKARVLDRQAAENLANATVLAKLTTQEALNAGAAAAHSKAEELLARVSKIEDQAEHAQVRSSALHAKATLETDEASELMAVADRALNHSPKQPL